MVVAPALIPRGSGERVQTNRRDALTLARLFRAGELNGVWVPDEVHEAIRDPVCGRTMAAEDVHRKRQRLLSFLLRHGRIFTGEDDWTARTDAGWPSRASIIRRSRSSPKDGIAAIEDAIERQRRIEGQLTSLVPKWSMAPAVMAYQAMRVVSFLVAVTFAAEIGDVRRFDTPRQLMLDWCLPSVRPARRYAAQA